MKSGINYRDIPEEERKRLAAAIRAEPKVVLPFAILMGLAVVGSDRLAAVTKEVVKAIFPADPASPWLHFLVDLAVLIPLAVVLGLAFRPWFRREVEKRWSAEHPDDAGS